jgi:ribosome maturation factor RimP
MDIIATLRKAAWYNQVVRIQHRSGHTFVGKVASADNDTVAVIHQGKYLTISTNDVVSARNVS